MPAKLIVHKYESGFNFTSLPITINESANGSPAEVIYGQWTVGSDCKNKIKPGSSSLVVKIVQESEPSILNLDLCAVEIKDPKNPLNHFNERPAMPTNIFSSSTKSNQLQTVNPSEGLIFTSPESNSHYNVEGKITEMSYLYEQNNEDSTESYTSSTLEQSLEKVRENNARIMKNIQILNVTLDYTKKKEFLDTVCPKSMRFSCDICGKCFVYETGLKRHYATRHEGEVQPRWQVVWTCVECFQVWPQHELALAHARLCCKSEDMEFAREIKTSSLIQCEFCDKVFTSIPRLLRHSKIHTTDRNYECNACKSSFQSYKAAELHWVMCPWLKIYYSFKLPKMWLCHVCDRKFKNYELLYNHRYKVGHYMAKYCLNSDTTNALDLVVYQCELCAGCFDEIPLLQNHRRTLHSAYSLSSNETNVEDEIDQQKWEKCAV